jgi:hypothetical protein
MFDQTTSAYARASYTLDASGVLAHLRDTATAYLSRHAATAQAMRIELPRSRVGPRAHHAQYQVPDAVRVR